ncbi:hypothetical protein GCM10009037_03630 [Halarchaeum grantii]|uniref:Uncharacterized protein n=1 Tax=Halarchaeum grantii TaxID=1193105 RepID=A0A830F5T5_9EURY|nr:DUF5796 family protein [Halarchaeum grantii]GGL23353.1 hypothetical protein GCM10009037_03630 [Halarchaeum grantii]
MSYRNDVAPETLPVELTEDGIVVTYADGRETFYHGAPERHEGTLRTSPGMNVQVLVCDPTETEGVMLYVNDRNTHDDILEGTGVGRVMLEPGETEEVFPGVTVEMDGYAAEITADPEVARGRVFVFEEDEMSEYSFELFAPEA